MSSLAWALDAVRRGFVIHPCEPGGKRPLIRWGEGASNDVRTVVGWWSRWTNANIGIACKPSSLLVVDCDLKPDGDGWQEFSSLASTYDPEWFLYYTLTVRTGGGGAHLYYRWPGHVQASQAGLCPHVDIRSNGGQCGGYVLAAGSVTSKGSYAIEEDEPIADAPAWLVELVREKPRPVAPRMRFGQPGAISYAGLVTAVATAMEGDRSNCLLWATRSMTSDGADLDAIMATLLSPATGNGLTEREASDTIRSGFRLQTMKGAYT